MSNETETVPPRQGVVRKNIVLCSDGTGNQGGRARGTNVWAVFKALDRTPESEAETGVRQVAFHDDGVGTQSFLPLKLLGGAFGWGYSRNIKELYSVLVRTYEPGDRIYLFGFSRGAYTVRALAGMIRACGVLKPGSEHFPSSENLSKAVSTMFRAYRDGYGSVAGEIRRALIEDGKKNRAALIAAGKVHEDVPIHFIGVWDTVDAVGMPVDELASALDHIVKFRFANNDLNKDIGKACHALAIDDERHTFWPVLWNEAGEPGDRIEQVWFSGVHSNVGGGYPKDELALVSLDWMMDRASASGLTFLKSERERIRAQLNVNGKLHDSRAGAAAYYRYAPRDIAKLCRAAMVDIARPKVHLSVFDRIDRATENYAPLSLTNDIEIVGTTESQSQKAKSLEEGLRDTWLEGATNRSEGLAMIGRRKWLYKAFLACTATIVALALIFRSAQYGLPTDEANSMPWPSNWIANVGGAVLPEFVVNGLKPLLAAAADNLWLGLPVLAALVVLIWLKAKWERATSRAGLDSWAPFRRRINPDA